LLEIVCADVVQSCNVVFVPMREEDGIQLHDSFPEHLLTEVRAGIDHKTFSVNAKVD
jgi:hypothetical protein